ncbi:MAG: DUF177 domain-containing protein [Anaerolineae bacterium]|nr:DUF177 domain-containing protein [Anaerolineae bacterium]
MLEFDLSPLLGVHPGERLVFSLDEGPATWQDIDAAFVRGTLTFTRVQQGILVEGELETQLSVECVRCLETFFVDVRLEIEEIIGVSGRPNPDITFRVTEEGRFNAVPLLRDQAWVALPMKPLCKPTCRGLCPECGTNLNLSECGCRREQTGSRFATLASLLTEQE